MLKVAALETIKRWCIVARLARVRVLLAIGALPLDIDLVARAVPHMRVVLVADTRHLLALVAQNVVLVGHGDADNEGAAVCRRSTSAVSRDGRGDRHLLLGVHLGGHLGGHLFLAVSWSARRGSERVTCAGVDASS